MVVHRYLSEVDGAGTRDVQAIMQIEVKTSMSTPTPSQLDTLMKLNMFRGEPKIVPHTPEAEAAYAALRRQSEREYAAAEARDDEVSRSAWTRNHENAGRFALLYACSKDHEHPVIDLKAVEWAGALAMHQTARKLALAAQYVAENPFHDECLKLMRKLRETPGGELPHQVLLKRMKLRAKDFKEVIETLEESGELVSEIKATSGRPAKMYRLAVEKERRRK